MKARRSASTILQQKNTLDSVIAHDLKNLAFRLSALTQNIDENFDNPMFRKSMSEILVDTIRSMETMVKQFRAQQEGLVAKLQLDVNPILAEVIGALPQRAVRNIRVIMQLGEVPTLWGDPYYLHTAFRSIVQNGLEAMPDGGTLTVETSAVDRRKKKKVCVTVSDTGGGMNKEFLKEHLFRPFHTTKQEGLGLGLFNCRQIVCFHHGSVEVESAPGEGTVFRVLLPAAASNAS